MVDKFSLDLPDDRSTTRGTTRSSVDTVAIDIELEADENAALLIEVDGVFEWHYPDKSASVRSQNRSGRQINNVSFSLQIGDGVAVKTTRSTTRGLVEFIKQSIFGKVKAFVFKFIARTVTGVLTQKLEHSVKPGPMLLVSEGATFAWKAVPQYPADKLPNDRDARILLLVHGTFSSTQGSFGALTETAEGKVFLAQAMQHYDVIVGFDHYTLSETPEQNARQIFSKLVELQGERSFKLAFDAIAFSRGGLVLRTLTEAVVPQESATLLFNRCVMVGCTNGGTELANEENWHGLIDLYTNLAAGAGRLLGVASSLTAVNVVIQSIGSLVRHIVVNAVKENGVPGLAAMRPSGDIVKQLNTVDSARGLPGFAEYYAIGSDFDADSGSSSSLGKGMLLRIGDGLVDRLMGEANDLVVNSESMFVIDPQPAARLVESRLFSNDNTIYHTVYFFQSRVATLLSNWLAGATRTSQEGRVTVPAITQGPDNESRVAEVLVPEGTRAETEARGSAGAISKMPSSSDGPILTVEVVWGDIRHGDGDIFCCGHYENVLPAQSERALDTIISSANWKALPRIEPADLVLRQLSQRGLIRGAIGDVYFYPRADEPRKLVAIAGMGVPGGFTKGGLRSLARSLAWTAGSLPNIYSLSTVLIGSGTGALSVETSVNCLLQGMSDALSSGLISNIHKVQIVELDLSRAHRIQSVVSALDSVDSAVRIQPASALVTGTNGVVSQELAASVILASGVEALKSSDGDISLQKLMSSLSLSETEQKAATGSIKKLQGQLSAANSDIADSATDSGLTIEQVLERYSLSLGSEQSSAQADYQRISFTRLAKSVRVSAITDTAVIPQEELRTDFPIIKELIARCVDPDTELMGELSYLLSNFLIPEKFRAIFKSNRPVVFDLDRRLAGVHWEMLSTNDSKDFDAGDPSCLGLNVAVARQLKTAYSPAFSNLAPSGTARKALVIGDPSGDLPAARSEALSVAALLKSNGFDVTLLIGLPGQLGRSDSTGTDSTGTKAAGPGSPVSEAATRFTVLRLLALEKFSLLHYAGHGDFDEDDPTRAGWLFGSELLTAYELENLRNPPDLIVANACLSGRTSNRLQGRRETDYEGADAGLLATLADEFFKKGVRNYIGTAWEVDDRGAMDFAGSFYKGILEDSLSLGEALLVTRKFLYERRASYKHLWAAYQHYGDPLARL